VGVSFSPFFQQEPWVLQSASADHPVVSGTPETPPACARAARGRRILEEGWHQQIGGNPEKAEALWRRALELDSGDLLLRRALNRLCPSLNHHPLPRRGSRPPWGAHVALLVPGELRCLEHSRAFLERLSRRADLFVCTDAAHREAAGTIRCRHHGEVVIIEDEPALAAEDRALPVGSMRQWQKLAQCLAMVRHHETRTGRNYTHLVKLRSDFLHVNPESFFEDLVHDPLDGLATASDKVFGGRRDLMLLFEGFHAAIPGHFHGREEDYWPINVEAILRSDDSCKWYGLNWPVRLVGEPVSVEELRKRLREGGGALAAALARFRPGPQERYHRFFRGDARFASEVCFARFLNFCGIPTHQNRSLRGFLRNDRASQAAPGAPAA
jgi:hypothetical protein